ncbi:MAG: 1-(5-phosphoribosyl)-5-[(5-phosphoribosylamino)methylideneamino]imidazole-4-carboxamide isomerase [Sporomusaceae bacterium]|nr:1-(5-phosphoribosyl)-5-[(5-phosphoribosylamino)methylideneamino]imidazole-4-carboxamide isomerase [Sporomusaceae bacterium]
MILFPAIDILGGKCVRLYKGDFSQETVFADRPADMALRWQEQGAKYFHVVDLDGAKEAKPVNISAIREILQEATVPVQLGGGIRDLTAVETWLNIGIERVILGSVAVRNPQLVKEAVKEFGEKIVVGIDAKAGIVAVDGWGVSGDMAVSELAERMADCGVTRLIYTDISRDGTLSGVNIAATADLAKRSGLKVIASGGVKDLGDIEALLACGEPLIEGVIVGKSIYTGSLDLREALARCEQQGGR